MSYKILTTHVGSLPRSKELSNLLFAKDKKESFNQNDFNEVVRNSVVDVVKKQSDIGIDIVSDGEMSKISYATYVKDRINGFSGESERRVPADLEDFPEYMKKIANSGGTPSYTRPCCTGKLEISDHKSIEVDLNNFLNALKLNKKDKGFLNAASPGVIAVFLPNKYYKNDDEYLEELSKLMTYEYKAITESGVQLQIDCPDLALARHMSFKHLSDEDFLKRVEKQIEYLNYSLEGIDSDMVRIHICWGNYEGPHTYDISLEKILPIILKVKAKFLLLESSNARHAHEWKVFENIKLPKDKILVPGLIDSTSNFVEHPELVLDRLKQFSQYVPKEQLMAGTDCGFSTFAGFGKVDENICYEKLKSLVSGASLASKYL